MVNWETNAHNLGKDTLFILFWVASWSLVDMIVNHLARGHQKPKVYMYVFLFVLSALLLLLLGNGYHE